MSGENAFGSEVRSGQLPFKWLMQEAGRSLPPFSEGLPSRLIQSRAAIIGSNDATRRRYCKWWRAYTEQGMKTASEASTLAAWAATAITKGRRACTERSIEGGKRSKRYSATAIKKGATGVRRAKRSVQQAKRALQPHELPSPIQRAACLRRARHRAQQARREPRAKQVLRLQRGGVRALSKASSVANEASAAAALVATTTAKGGVRSLSEARQPHRLPPPLKRAACVR